MKDRRALLVATAAYVLGWTAHTTFIFYLAPVALRVAQVTGRDSWVFAGTAVASILSVLPAGFATDRYPRRRVLRFALALMALSYAPLLFAPPSLGAILLSTALTGTALGFLFVAFNAYVPDLLADRPASTAYGNAGAWSTLASASGPAVAALVFALLPDAPGIRGNAALFGAGALVGALLTLRLPRVARREQERPGPLRADLPVVGPAFLIYLFVGAGYGMTMPYFTVHFLDHLGMPKESWGLVLAVGTALTASGSMLVGYLGRVLPRRRLMVAAQIVVFTASVAFAFPLLLSFLVLAYLGRSLFGATTAPIVSTIIADKIAPQARGRAQSLGSLAWNLGWASGAAAGGVLLLHLSGGLFPLGASLALTGVAVGAWLLRRA